MSAVVYDVGYDTRMIKTRKKHGYCAAFGCYKGKTTSQDIDRPKVSRFRSTLPYLNSEYRNLHHNIPLTISFATTVPNLF